MERSTLSPPQNSVIYLDLVGATLNAKGWDQDEIRIETRRLDMLETEETDDGLRIRCKENLSLRIPQDSSLVAQSIGGSATVRGIHGDIILDSVGGSLVVKDAASLEVGSAAGSLNVKTIDGDVEVNNIAGSANVKTVAGELSLSNVTGSTNIKDIAGAITVRNASGSLNVRDNGPQIDIDCRGNASLRLSSLDEGDHSIKASGNVFCHLRHTDSLAVAMESKGGKIHVYSPDGMQTLNTMQHQMMLGDGEGKLLIEAGGSITLDTRSKAQSFSFDLDFDEDFEGEFESLADEISEQITGQMEGHLEELNAQLETMRGKLAAAGSTTRRHLRHTEKRIDAAQRRLQQRLERKRAMAAAKGAKKAEPVAEIERMKVLQMIQEKRISVEEAEMLLNALEGRPVAAAPPTSAGPKPPKAPKPPKPPEAPQPPHNVEEDSDD